MSTPSESGGIADSEVRRRALAVDSSFIVQAPAGSGKTELLIQRFLALLAIASRPEAVVAVTFTRKAAAEMRERVIHALTAVADGEPSEPYRRDRYELARAVLARSEQEGWNLVDSPHRLEINTIDSLCAKLVRALPLLSAFGGTPTPTDDAEPLYREAVRRALDDAPNDPQLGADLTILLSRYEMRRAQVEKQLIHMLGKRDQWTSDALEVRTDEGAREMLELVARGIDAAVREVTDAAHAWFTGNEISLIHKLACVSRGQIEEDGKKPCPWPTLGASDLLEGGIESVNAWKQACALLFTGSFGIRKRRPDGTKKDTSGGDLWESFEKRLLERNSQSLDRIVEIARALTKLPTRAGFSPETEEGVLATFRLLLQAHRELWALFVERGETDFVELSRKALAALGSEEAPTDLLQRLDRDVEHLLVDEYQDTSISQNELIRRITAGWAPGDGRTLFLVGDPMQSIYRFRKAEVGLFLKARSDAGLFENIDTQVLQLTVNFRSQPRIIDWVNRHFAALMGDEDDIGRGVVSYAPSLACDDRDDGPDPEVRLWADLDEQAGQGERGEQDEQDESDLTGSVAAEAEGVAALIADELRPEAQRRGGRVAVLVTVKAHAKPLLAALRARSIAYVPEGLDTLYDRPAIQDLRSLTRFILHRGDRLCGLALLRSPLVGLTLGDLANLVEPDVVAATAASAGPGSSQRLSDVTDLMRSADDRVSADGRARIAHTLALLDAVRGEQGRRRLCDLLEGTWIALGGPATTGPEIAHEIQAYFALIAECERAGCVDRAELDRRLRAADAPTPVAAAESDVAVMTMYAAKGLEFDTVVLLRLGHSPRSGDSPPLVFETDPQTGRMSALALAKQRGADAEDDLKYAMIQERERARNQGEQLRLLYVGTTRAKHRLVMSAAVPKVDKEGEYAPSSRSMLGSLAAAGALRAAQPLPVDTSSVDLTERMPRLAVGTQSILVPKTAPVRLRFESRPSDVDDEINPETFDASSLKRNVGVCTHSFLERIALEGLDAWNDDRVASVGARVRRVLLRLGTPGDELDDGEMSVLRALTTMLDDPTGRWLLDEHEHAHAEWKLSRWASHGLDGHGGGHGDIDETSDVDRNESVAETNASLDRSFVDNGVRWIIDYKVVEPSGSENLDDFVAAKVAHYREQLESYARLVGELEPDRPIRLGLYFPLLKRFAWWHPGSTEFSPCRPDV